MKLLSEINEAADSLINTTKIVTENIEFLLADGTFGIEQLNEAVQQFLNTYANKIANGQLEGNPKVKENVINIFAALQALSQPDLADAHDDNPRMPLGQVLSDFYGKNGKEAHKIAAARLNEIGKDPSSRTYRTQAEQAVNSPEHITAFANKIRTKIEPVMNSMLSKERQAAQGRLDKQAEEKKRAEMGRPMVGAVPQQS
jgi:hypothetical protein